MNLSQRHQLGQWFTPAPVVDLALALAKPCLSDKARIVDPACGDGAFLAGALRCGLRAAQLTGIDVDAAAAGACRDRLPEVDISVGDVFSVAPAGSGFDVVIGNPPYVRAERLGAVHKRRVRARLAADWPELPAAELSRVVGRGDLAAAFLLHSLRLLRPGGRLVFVLSSAILDAGYAAQTWALINRVARAVTIVDAPAERWFADAAVNTIIVALERIPAEPTDRVTIARLREPTAAAAQTLRGPAELARVAELRRVAASQPTTWPAALRASPAWFELAEAVGERLVPLSALAELRRGVTSGANSFFYMTRDVAAERGLEPALLMPMVRSPRARGAQRIVVDPARTSHVALVCPEDLSPYPRARAYVRDHAELAHRPTLRNRRPWWRLPCHPARLFLTKAYAARFVQRFSPRPLLADQRVYSVSPREGVAPALLAAALNSTFTALALESLGRASMGEGALEWTVADAAKLPVVDVRGLDAAAASRVADAFTQLSRRPIGDVTAERAEPDRRALDTALLPGVALPAIHAALIDAVRQRSARSASCL